MKKSKLAVFSSGFVACAVGAVTLEDPSGNKYEIGGFAKVEWSKAGQSPKIVPDDLSTYTIDNRNVLSSVPSSAVLSGPKSSQLGMQQLTLGVSRETDSAVGLEAKVTYRWRSASVTEVFSSPDVDYTSGGGLSGRDFTEKLVGINRPDLGALRVGTQLSRSWSRSDSFSFPVGMSSQWADSGAGFGVLPQAVRLTSPIFEDGTGKLSAEVTLARNGLNTQNVDQNLVQLGSMPTRPDLKELFFQYSNQKNLIELVIQSTSGAKQTAFGKSALVGWIGDPDNLSANSPEPRRALKPSQSVVILQGNHWPNPQNMMTWGLRRSQWSGSAATCNYSSQLVLGNGNTGGCVFGLEPGFNYGPESTNFRGYRATTWDALLGWSHYVGLYTYTVSGVYFGAASSDNPIEWGQSNSAVSVNLGVSRKVPEVHKGLTVSGGVAFAKFKRLGPAPLSMPNNSFLGINSLYDKSGYSMSLGATWVF
jgi:hypothetical protein